MHVNVCNLYWRVKVSRMTKPNSPIQNPVRAVFTANYKRFMRSTHKGQPEAVFRSQTMTAEEQAKRRASHLKWFKSRPGKWRSKVFALANGTPTMNINALSSVCDYRIFWRPHCCRLRGEVRRGAHASAPQRHTPDEDGLILFHAQTRWCFFSVSLLIYFQYFTEEIVNDSSWQALAEKSSSHSQRARTLHVSSFHPASVGASPSKSIWERLI